MPAPVLVFLLLQHLVPRVPAAIGALVFAVHPVHTEVVAHLVGQAEIVTHCSPARRCLLHAARPAGVAVSWSRRLLLLASTCWPLHQGERGPAPGLLVLIDAAAPGALVLLRLARYADAMLMPILLLAAGFAFTRSSGSACSRRLHGRDWPAARFLKEHWLLNAFRAFPEFMRLLFFPAQLSADYSPAVILPVESMTPMAGLGLALLLALTLLALLTPTAPALGFPAAWFLIGISVVSNLFFPVGILVAERALYLPSIAVAAVAAYAWRALHTRVTRARRTGLQLALAAIVLALGARTWIRNPDWASTSAVFTAIVRDRTESYRAQWALAAQRQSAGDRFMAGMHYEAAYRIYPYNSELLTEYANFLLIQKRYPRAVALLEAANHMHPRVMRTASMLGYAYLAAGRFADALPVIQRLNEIGAPRASTMPMWAYAYENLGQTGRAAAAWRVALRQPGVSTWRNWSFLARALALRGYQQQALEAAAHAESLASDSAADRQVAGLLTALRSGCYQQAAAAPSGTGGAPVRPACDPLGDWLHDAAPQTATRLQNARPAAPRSSWSGFDKAALSH
jgi:tetratricopeptide (TPR) repeat protein